MARLRLIMIWLPGNKTTWINPEQIVEFGQDADNNMVLRMANGSEIITLSDMGTITNKAGGDYIP